MLEKELKKKLFSKKREETDYFGFQQMASPITQLNPSLDRLIKRVRAKMDEKSKQQEAILNRIPTQSKETAKKFIYNQKVATHLILNKFEKACSLAVSLPSQSEEQIGENNKSKQQSAFSQCNYFYDSQLNQPIRHSSSIMEQYREFYLKPYQTHGHKRAQIFSKHPKLFQALAKNLQILLDWLQSNNTNEQLMPKLKHVLPFRLKQVQFKNNLKDEQKWLEQKFKQEYVMIMQCGDNSLYSSTIPIHMLNKENPFKIKDYLSGKDQSDVLDYFLQVSRALAELIRHKIYHMDVQPRNIIPKTNKQGEIEYKLIDFEISIFLDSTKPNVHKTLTEIWSLTRGYWKKKDYQIVHNLFDCMLCQKHQKICQLFRNLIKAPGVDLYNYLFVEKQDLEQFIEYLMIYMECYYRNALLEILGEIMEKSKWLSKHYKQLRYIITRKQFSKIDQAIYSLWSSRL